MGRNFDSKNLVPIGSEVYRNANEGVIVDATGAVFVSSASSSNVLKVSDYPKFCNPILESYSHTSYLPSKGPVGTYNNGKLVTQGTVPTPQYCVGSTQAYITPIGPHSTATFARGASATNGSNLAVAIGMAPQNNTYYYQSTMTSSAVGMNISTYNVLSIPMTDYAIHVWYDTTTSKFRLLGPGSLMTSTDAISWTTEANPSLGNYNWWNFANGCYYSAIRAKNQTVIAVGDSTQNNSGYKVLISTDGGANFTDRSTEYSGAGTFTGGAGAALNYDGTTIYLAGFASNTCKFSTNNGATWTSSTFSSGSYLAPINNQTVCKGSTDSIFMFTTGTKAFYTTNGGQSFTVSDLNTGITVNGTGALVHNGNSTWAFPIRRNSDATNFIFTSVNNGATWTSYQLPASCNTYQMYYFDAFYFVDHQNNIIYKSTNGTTWTKIYDQSTSGMSLGSPTYGNPVVQTDNYIIFTNLSYNKTTGEFKFVTSQYVTTVSQGYGFNFSAQLTSAKAFQVGENTSYQKFVSDDVGGGTVTYISTQYLSSQQGSSSSNSPRNIAYWRIK